MIPPETLVLTRRDVARLLPLSDCIAAVETAFQRHAEGRSLAPAVLGIPARDGGFHVKAAGLELSRTYFAVKTNGNFFFNRERFGMENIQGVVLLFDGANGYPLAVLDSIEITVLRTGAATAVAARHLARADSRVVTICGCGNQGRVQLRALALVRPIERCFAYDVDPSRARLFAEELSAELQFPVEVASDPGAAARQSDVCVTCTPSRRVFLRAGDLSPGAFLAAVGADAADKQEIEPALLAQSRVVVDVLDQCAAIGELHHAIENGSMAREDIHAELAEVVAGSRPGRTSSEEIFIFDSTGTAIEDVAAAAAVYERAVEAGAGLSCRIGA
ncbi:MAG: ornithine cyclodeaminase family protein [Acidobacteriota bacterium]|nr:ornithine cyclodeaminase family protein [Acidobacteriota bacterium]